MFRFLNNFIYSTSENIGALYMIGEKFKSIQSFILNFILIFKKHWLGINKFLFNLRYTSAGIIGSCTLAVSVQSLVTIKLIALTEFILLTGGFTNFIRSVLFGKNVFIERFLSLSTNFDWPKANSITKDDNNNTKNFIPQQVLVSKKPKFSSNTSISSCYILTSPLEENGWHITNLSNFIDGLLIINLGTLILLIVVLYLFIMKNYILESKIKEILIKKLTNTTYLNKNTKEKLLNKLNNYTKKISKTNNFFILILLIIITFGVCSIFLFNNILMNNLN